MGIGYVDSVIVYNRYVNGLLEITYYIGTRFDNVRVELTQGANIRTSGMENADSCLVKILNNGNLPKPYKAPEVWNNLPTEEMQKYFTLDKDENSFFAIVKKKELGIDVDLPVGIIESGKYPGGFYEYIRDKYGYTYNMTTVDVYNLIPRFEVGGR